MLNKRREWYKFHESLRDFEDSTEMFHSIVSLFVLVSMNINRCDSYPYTKDGKCYRKRSKNYESESRKENII